MAAYHDGGMARAAVKDKYVSWSGGRTEATMMRAHIGQLLKRQGLVDDQQVAAALAYQQRWGCRIGSAMLRLRIVAEDDLLAAIGMQLAVPVVKIGTRKIPQGVLRRLPEAVIRKYRALPLETIGHGKGERLVVAFTSPDDVKAVDAVAFAANMPVDAVLCGDDDFTDAVARHFDAPPVEPLELSDADAGPIPLVDGRLIDSI